MADSGRDHHVPGLYDSEPQYRVPSSVTKACAATSSNPATVCHRGPNRVGAYSCLSTEAALVCQHVNTKHGFSLARAGYQLS